MSAASLLGPPHCPQPIPTLSTAPLPTSLLIPCPTLHAERLHRGASVGWGWRTPVEAMLAGAADVRTRAGKWLFEVLVRCIPRPMRN